MKIIDKETLNSTEVSEIKKMKMPDDGAKQVGIPPNKICHSDVSWNRYTYTSFFVSIPTNIGNTTLQGLFCCQFHMEYCNASWQTKVKKHSSDKRASFNRVKSMVHHNMENIWYRNMFYQYTIFLPILIRCMRVNKELHGFVVVDRVLE